MEKKAPNDGGEAKPPKELWVLLRTEGDGQVVRLCTSEEACISVKAEEYNCDADSKAEFSHFDVSDQARAIGLLR